MNNPPARRGSILGRHRAVELDTIVNLPYCPEHSPLSWRQSCAKAALLPQCGEDSARRRGGRFDVQPSCEAAPRPLNTLFQCRRAPLTCPSEILSHPRTNPWPDVRPGIFLPERMAPHCGPPHRPRHSRATQSSSDGQRDSIDGIRTTNPRN